MHVAVLAEGVNTVGPRMRKRQPYGVSRYSVSLGQRFGGADLVSSEASDQARLDGKILVVVVSPTPAVAITLLQRQRETRHVVLE